MNVELTEDGMVRCIFKIAPYSRRPICPACGYKRDFAWRRFLRFLRGKAPESLVSYTFCAGSKPPTEERPSFLMLGTREVTNKCAGIEVAHLHAQCRNCSAEWICATKEAM